MAHFLWIDLEMTGLDEKKDSILEMAAAITDQNLVIKDKLHHVVFQPPEVLAGMNDWCKKAHGESGLTAEVATGTPLDRVEAELIDFISKVFRDPKERIVLAGNSIGNDRRFIDAYMPKLAERLHYRMIDVSSFKEVFRDRYGLKYEKRGRYRALGDIEESIAELNYYLSFVQPPSSQKANDRGTK